jgi:hypothetical protein
LSALFACHIRPENEFIRGFNEPGQGRTIGLRSPPLVFCTPRKAHVPCFWQVDIEQQETGMARKLATVGQFALFDVFYEDGSQRSNRRVPLEALGGYDGDAPARTVIEEQDRLIAEKSGSPALAIKSISRSKGK